MVTVRMLRSRARQIARRLTGRGTSLPGAGWHEWTAREQSIFMLGVGAGYGWNEQETARLADAVSSLMLTGYF